MVHHGGHLFLLYLVAWTCVPAVQPMPSRQLKQIDLMGMAASSPPPKSSPPPSSPSPSSPPPGSPAPSPPPTNTTTTTTSTTSSPPPPVIALAPLPSNTSTGTISLKAAANGGAGVFCFNQYCMKTPPPPPPPLFADDNFFGRLIAGLFSLPAFITGLFFIPYVSIKSIVDQTPLYVEAAKAYASGRPDLAKQLFDRSEWQKGEYLKSAFTNITQDVRTFWQPYVAPFVNWADTNASSWGWQGAIYGSGKNDILYDSIGTPGNFQYGKIQIGRKLLALFAHTNKKIA